MQVRYNMWHLIRTTSKKEKGNAEAALRASNLSFFPISSIVEQHRPQPAVRFLLQEFVDNSYFVETNDEGTELDALLTKNKGILQRVRRKAGQQGHVQLSQEEMDQFVLTLQIPESYTVVRIEEVPTGEQIKEMTLPQGPLKGLKGVFLDTKTPKGKRFYLSVLQRFCIEVRIPIRDVKKGRKQEKVALNYLTNEREPQWFLLSCLKKEYIERLLGETLNTWNPDGNDEVVVTHLPLTEEGYEIQTVRFLYQAIYRRHTKEGVEEVNLMPHYFFFRTNRYDLETFRDSRFNSHIYVMRNSDGTPIRIPEMQVRIFARFLKERSEATEALYEDYREGDVAHIAMGVEKSNQIEGVVHIVTQKHYILVSDNGFKINVRKGKKK